MKSLFRGHLISIAALIAYVAVHVGGAALHHHLHNAQDHEASDETVRSAQLQIQTPSADDDDDDGEDGCLLCKVLHFGQTPPPVFHIEITAAVTGDRSIVTPLVRPYPFATILRSRAPPVM